MNNCLVHGDACDVLASVPDDNFHLTFTSPPYYNARDYASYKSYEEYLSFLRSVFQLVHSKTKEGRFCVVNTSPVLTPRVGRMQASKRHPIPFDLHALMVEMGWEFIDDIVWVKPEASVKNRMGNFFQNRKPLAYKPNSVTEYLFVYRKKTDKLIDWCIRQYDDDVKEKSKVKGEFQTNNVWEIPPASHKTHSAVFPAKLCKEVLRYYSFVGDLVLDPFAGIGTMGKVAIEMGRKCFMIERDDRYFKEAKHDFSKRVFPPKVLCISAREL